MFGVVFIAITFGYIAWEQRDRLLQQITDNTRSNAFFLADHAARLFEVSDLALQKTATLIEEQNWSTIQASRPLWEEMRAINETLPYIENIWLNDSDGQLRLTTAEFPAPPANAAGRDVFTAQRDAATGLFVGAPIIGRLTQRPTFVVSRRLEFSDGTFRGIMSVTVSLAYFYTHWNELRLPKGSRVTLFRANDRAVLAQLPPPADGVSFVPVESNAFLAASEKDSRQGTMQYEIIGEERIGSYHKVGAFPLYILVSMPKSAYWMPWVAQARLYGIFALVALLALLALTGFASQQFREHALNAALLERDVAMRTSELQAETTALEILNRTITTLAAELDIDRIVQNVIDAGVELSGAQFGSFFYRGDNDPQDSFTLFALAGASRDAFAHSPAVRVTEVFRPTFSGEGVVRSDDITTDPRYGHNAPFTGMPNWHLPVRSYLAVPVVSRTGEVHGALLFGHTRPGVFTERSERLMVGLAGQAAIALDNGHLYQAAQHEISERKHAQAQQSLLIRELHHRVKNTLATVQAVVGATARATSSVDEFYQAFVGRIISLANTHSLLTEALWQTASLRELVEKELSPYNDDTGVRVSIDGEPVELPSDAAVPIGMAIHELTTNAAKYGALSVSTGRVAVGWTVDPDIEGGRLRLEWREAGGPKVVRPRRQGFGSRLLNRVLAAQLNARVETNYDPQGLHVTIEALLKHTEPLDSVG
ncbi:HWE histidine kinase domain-containing protein [Microvirga flavescens]|uniref:HWE histidine kinase domain-containing protein n=1 Tax=Microvirga flavescens TaxID=2249811 RepID=UPI001FE1D8A6|nr:HWE histidine kinase domain-containing protein [Microvirga flavescens]